MARGRRGPASLVLALAAFITACAPPAGQEPAGGATAFRLRFEDQPRPTVFSRDGLGRREADGSPGGLWAVVAGLPRPERALVRNLETDAEVAVALYAARSGTQPGDIRLSPEAAEALGIGDRPAPVRVVVLRREPRLVAPEDAF